MNDLSVCMSVCHLHPSGHRGQKAALDFLGLECLKVANHHVDARNQTWVLWMRSKCS